MSASDIKKDFPILRKLKGKRPLFYLDSAATSQKPQAVIQAERDWYERWNANVHRGVYELSEKATMKYETARARIAKFIGASSNREIVLVRGATEGINLVAHAWGRKNLKRGDTVLLTEMEHHANLVPWQKLARDKGLQLAFLEFDSEGELRLDDLQKKLKGVRLIALTHVSNVLGTINPVTKIIETAHAKGIPVLVDAAQSVPHLPINVQKMDADWLVFSGHKMLGPTGIGVLYVKRARFKEMDVYQTGGDMIQTVSLKNSTYKQYPWKFEAGTQHLAGVFGLSEAMDYLDAIGMQRVSQHDKMLVNYAASALRDIPDVTVYGPRTVKRAGCVSFIVEGMHPHDLASLLSEEGIAIRAGHHCAMPLHEKLGVSATARVSFYIYNDKKDVDVFIKALRKIIIQWKTSTARK